MGFFGNYNALKKRKRLHELSIDKENLGDGNPTNYDDDNDEEDNKPTPNPEPDNTGTEAPAKQPPANNDPYALDPDNDDDEDVASADNPDTNTTDGRETPQGDEPTGGEDPYALDNPDNEDGEDDYNIPDNTDAGGNEDGDPYALDNPDNESETSEPDNTGVENEAPDDNEDDPYALDNPDNDDGGAEPTADNGNEDGDPYALDNPDNEGGGENENNGDKNTEDSTGDSGVDVSTGDSIANDLKAMEDEIFADLTDQQKDIRDNELKQSYISLYNTIDDAEKRINNIVKDECTGRVLEFITRKMNELKQLVHHNLTKVFTTRTYIENQTALNQCIAIMNTICDMLDSIAKDDEDESIKDK